MKMDVDIFTKIAHGITQRPTLFVVRQPSKTGFLTVRPIHV